MNSNGFEANINNLYQSKNYSEIVRIASFFDIKLLSVQTVELIAIAYFKNKNFNQCIKLCEFLIGSKDLKKYFIYEILAESYFSRNNLENSLLNFDLALSLNSKLISASFKNFFLKYRLTKKIDFNNLDFYIKSAKEKKRYSFLRILSYIQFNEGFYNDAYENLKLVINANKNPFLCDYLTIVEIIKNINKEIISSNLSDEIKEYENKAKEFYFKSEFSSSGKKTLLITFSPSNSFILKKYPYDADKLSLVDVSASYFCLSAVKIFDYICELVEKYSYDKLSLVGSSKGATGVILLMNLLQKKFPEIHIKAVACSPQIQLWPFKSNLEIPSYRLLSEYFSCNFYLEECLKIAQDLIKFDILPHNNLTVFYGNRFFMDKREALNINKISDQVKLIELDYSSHGTLIPITIPENKTKAELKDKYESLAVDPDFQALGGESLVSVVDEIYTIYSNPDMRLHKYL